MECVYGIIAILVLIGVIDIIIQTGGGCLIPLAAFAVPWVILMLFGIDPLSAAAIVIGCYIVIALVAGLASL